MSDSASLSAPTMKSPSDLLALSRLPHTGRTLSSQAISALDHSPQATQHTFLTLAPATSAVYEKLASPPQSPAATEHKPVLAQSSVKAVTGIAVPGGQPTLDGVALGELDVELLKLRGERSASLGSEGSDGGGGSERRFLRLGPVHGGNDVAGLVMGDWSEAVA